MFPNACGLTLLRNRNARIDIAKRREWINYAGMRSGILSSWGAGLLCLASVAVFPANAGATADARLITLPNGMHLVLSPDRRYPRVALVVRYQAGIRHEPPGKSGVAHLLEHATFRPPRPAALTYVNEAAFASHGENASTHLEHTQYYHLEPSYRFRGAVWEERWRLTAMPDKWSSSDVKAEKPIVRNEERWRRETRPHFVSEAKLWQAMFPPKHPFAHTLRAEDESFGKIGFEDVQSFFTNWYVPQNTWVAAVGDFDMAAAEAMLVSYFGDVPAKPAPPLPALPPVGISEEVRMVSEDPLATHEQLMMAWHAPAAFTPGSAEAELTAELLAGVRAARLRMEVPGASWVSASFLPARAGSLFFISAAPLPGISLATLQNQIDASIMRLANAAPTDRELDRATRNLLHALFLELEQPLSKANVLIDVMSHVGDKDPVALQRQRYLDVTGKQVSDFVAQTLATHKRAVVQSLPRQGARK